MPDVLGLFDALIAQLQEGRTLLEQEKAASFQAGYKEGYDLGYLEGKASVVLPDPQDPEKLFTQADMDRLAEIAKAEQLKADTDLFKPQIDALTVQAAALGEELVTLKAQLEVVSAEAVLAKDVAAQAVASFDALKADFDGKVLEFSEERVVKVKAIAKEALSKMVVADQPLADEAAAQIDAV